MIIIANHKLIKMKGLIFSITIVFLHIQCIAISQTQILLTEFATGLDKPLDIVHAGGTDIYVAERPGRIQKVDENGVIASIPYLDITDRVISNTGERGLLGLAFHPNFPDSNYIYCNYTGTGVSTYISRFEVNSMDSASASSEEILLSFAQPFTNHNGGDLQFGPNGYLYIGSGDGGSSGDPLNNGQDLSTYLGKILRIDVDAGLPYGIPPNNPFVDSTGALDEIWAYGLRNPWRFDFDEISDALFVGDVGQNAWEEISKLDATGVVDPNYGWRCYEGTHPFSSDTSCESINDIPPIYEYPHLPGPGCHGSITGGLVYRGTDMPSLHGHYFYADYCTGFIAVLDLNNFEADTLYPSSSFSFSTFGEDFQKRLFIAELNSGIIYRISTPPTDFIFTIILDGSQASTPSTATGYGIATFDSTSQVINVSGVFDELIGNVTAAHVHMAPAGSNGGIVFPLTITDYGTDSIGFYGSATLSGSQTAALLSDGLYANIHSTSYTGGEIRGQIIGVTCPLGYAAYAPLLPEGEYKVDDATIRGLLTSDRDVIMKFQESAVLIEGFELSLGSTLEILQEICGP